MRITDNKQFRIFREQLRKEGITLAPWGTVNSKDVCGFNIIGAHPDAPKTAIAVCYGEDGFGWFPESRNLRIADDVKALTEAS